MNVVVEVVIDTTGKLLWTREYPLSRMYAIGDTFIENSVEYRVIGSALTNGKHAIDIVEHVVKVISGARKT